MVHAAYEDVGSLICSRDMSKVSEGGLKSVMASLIAIEACLLDQIEKPAKRK